MEYTGYLAPHIDLIRTAHARGADTRMIAEQLFEAGAKASASDPGVHELGKAHHIQNLTMMAGYVLRRLGLPVRESRSQPLRDARALALRKAGWTFRRIGEALGVKTERARQLLRKAERLSLHPHWRDKLPTRVRNFLRTSGLAGLSEIEAARAVARMSRRELLTTPNIGRGAASAVMAWLSGHGLRLQPEITLKAARVSAVPHTVHDDVNEMAAVAGTTAIEGCPPSPNEEPERCTLTPATGSRQHR